MLIYFPVLVCIAGLILWLASKSEPPRTIGMWMFICGLLVSLLEIGQKVIHIP